LLNDLSLTDYDFAQFAENRFPDLSDPLNSLKFPQFRFGHGGFLREIRAKAVLAA
jgi:hypothetical protein